MKYLAVLVLVALGVAVALSQQPVSGTPGEVPGRETPPVSICPIVQAGERTTDLAVLSSINGEGRLSTFSAGDETGSTQFRTGGSGSVILPATDAGAVGISGGLVEMPSEATATGVLISGPTSLSAESCADIPTGSAYISGGSTASGASFEIQLLNPYAGEAVANLTVSTEAGLESDERFDAVIVPPLSTITLDMNELIPGRETISVDLETVRGSLLGVGRQTTDGETAVWRAVEPGLDWWLPVPPGGGFKQLRIGTPSSTEVEYQVDYYGPDGFTESMETGALPPRGTVRVGLGAISEQAFGVRIITTEPVVPILWMDSPVGLAATTASQVDAPVWLLPGANSPPGGSGKIVVLNGGLEDVTVTVRSIKDTALTRDFQLAAEGVLVVDLVAADGYRVEATGPVTALWTSELNGASTAAMGTPIQDG